MKTLKGFPLIFGGGGGVIDEQLLKMLRKAKRVAPTVPAVTALLAAVRPD